MTIEELRAGLEAAEREVKACSVERELRAKALLSAGHRLDRALEREQEARFALRVAEHLALNVQKG